MRRNTKLRLKRWVETTVTEVHSYVLHHFRLLQMKQTSATERDRCLMMSEDIGGFLIRSADVTSAIDQILQKTEAEHNSLRALNRSQKELFGRERSELLSVRGKLENEIILQKSQLKLWVDAASEAERQSTKLKSELERREHDLSVCLICSSQLCKVA